MGSLEAMKGEKIHARNITIETFRVDEMRILIEGRLEDERMVGSHTLSGRRVEPGRFHGMVVRFLVGETPPRILDAQAEMPEVPRQECAQAAASVEKLVGLPIVYGYSLEVKNRLGGTNGCTHLMSLVLAMGSAAIQGFAANRGSRIMEAAERMLLLQYVKNSCMLWTEDGEFFKKTMEEIEAGKGIGRENG